MKSKMSGVCILIFISLFSCSTLHSTTTIDADTSFVLGNNSHGVFSVEMKNISQEEVRVYMAPVAGGHHSFDTVKPGEQVNLRTERNTALVIENNSGKQVNVQLRVHGDTGLSMGYKK